jgi:hypothetical protein
MNDDDATPAYRPEPHAAFIVAIETLVRRRDRLAISIQRHDAEDVERTARNAVNVWLAGRAALRRLGERADDWRQHLDGARCLLDGHHRALLDVFELAAITIPTDQLHLVLGELRGVLTAAKESSADVAPSKPGQSGESRSADDRLLSKEGHFSGTE